MAGYTKKDLMNLGMLCVLASAIVMIVWATYDDTEEHRSKRKTLSITYASLFLAGAVVLFGSHRGAFQIDMAGVDVSV